MANPEHMPTNATARTVDIAELNFKDSEIYKAEQHKIQHISQVYAIYNMSEYMLKFKFELKTLI